MIKTKLNKKVKFWEANNIVDRNQDTKKFYKFRLDDQEKINKVKKTHKINKIKKNSIFKINLDKYDVLEKLNYLFDFFKNNENNDGYIYLKIDLSKHIKQHYMDKIKIKLPSKIYSLNLSNILLIHDSEQNKLLELDIDNKIKLAKLDSLLKNTKNSNKFFKNFDIIMCKSEKIFKIFNKKFGIGISKYNLNIINLNNELSTPNIESLWDGTYLKLNLSNIFNLKVAHISQNKKEIIKNIIHGFYNSISEILSKSEKFTSVKKVSIYMKNSKLIDIYYNEDVK